MWALETRLIPKQRVVRAHLDYHAMYAPRSPTSNVAGLRSRESLSNDLLEDDRSVPGTDIASMSRTRFAGLMAVTRRFPTTIEGANHAKSGATAMRMPLPPSGRITNSRPG